MTSHLTLNCLLDGDPPSNAFPVYIDRDNTIGELKDVIKKKLTPMLDEILAHKLVLYRAPSLEDDESPVSISNTPEKEVLKGYMRVSSCFKTELPLEEVHVVIYQPATRTEAAVMTQFKVVVQNEAEVSILWATIPKTATLEGLRSFVRLSLDLHPERQIVVFDRPVCSSFPKGGLVTILGDRDLQELLEIYVQAKLDTLSIRVEFIRKGFSKFEMSDIVARLGSDKFDRMELGRFDCSHGEARKVLEKLWMSLELLVPEKTIAGSWGNGRVDYSIESRGHLEVTIVGVAEAKTHSTFGFGLPQLLAGLEATLSNRVGLDCRSNGELTDLESFGLLTDGIQWEFIGFRMKMSGASGNKSGINPEFVVRRETVPIRIDYANCDWKNQVQDVFENVAWLFEKMTKAIVNPKRRLRDAEVLEP
ncbi:hypothetical protein BGW42_003751 [Actinomortierella wolfii]|nr:hypothetical protein BGW42_003751 [Actinomortierella wolfii]